MTQNGHFKATANVFGTSNFEQTPSSTQEGRQIAGAPKLANDAANIHTRLKAIVFIVGKTNPLPCRT